MPSKHNKSYLNHLEPYPASSRTYAVLPVRRYLNFQLRRLLLPVDDLTLGLRGLFLFSLLEEDGKVGNTSSSSSIPRNKLLVHLFSMKLPPRLTIIETQFVKFFCSIPNICKRRLLMFEE